MFSRAALAAFALVVAEYFVFGFAAQLVGVSLVIWTSLAALVFGIFWIRRSFARLVAAGVEPLQNVHGAPAARSRPNVADSALGILAGILLVLPGLLTGSVGLALLLPPVRALVRSRVRHRAEGLVNQGFVTPDGLHFSFASGARMFGRRDIVDIDLHTEEPSPDDDTVDDNDGPTTAPPELH